jgi:hypothetical protein
MASNPGWGLNRTGIRVSPIGTGRKDSSPSDPSGSGDEHLARSREDHVSGAEPVGSVPPREPLPGIDNSWPPRLAGRGTDILVDKLGERLAFQRLVTRLYDALLAKFRAAPAALPDVPRDLLRTFRDEDATHFNILADAMERLGADPTAQTPAADVLGVCCLGLLQAMDDPRTTLSQSLEVLFTAELLDHEGWNLLIDLARELGESDLVKELRGAHDEERRHLAEVRYWRVEAILGEAT